MRRAETPARTGGRCAPALLCLLLLAGCASEQLLRRDGGGAAGRAGAAEPFQLQREAEAAYEAGEWQRAATAYGELTGLAPKDAQFWFRLGNARARLGDSAGAVQAYQSALRARPDMAKAWHNMGIIQLRAAVQSFAELLERTPVDDPLYEKARHYSVGLSAVLQAREQDGEAAAAPAAAAPAASSDLADALLRERLDADSPGGEAAATSP